MRRIFSKIFKSRLKSFLRSSYREFEDLGEFGDEEYDRKKFIDTKFYDEIKFKKLENEDKDENQTKEIRFNSSIDLLREVEIRVLNYINEYSDSKIVNISEIPLDVKFSKIGKN